MYDELTKQDIAKIQEEIDHRKLVASQTGSKQRMRRMSLMSWWKKGKKNGGVSGS